MATVLHFTAACLTAMLFLFSSQVRSPPFLLPILKQAKPAKLVGSLCILQCTMQRPVIFKKSFECLQIFQKTYGLFSRISALASKKRSNQKSSVRE